MRMIFKMENTVCRIYSKSRRDSTLLTVGEAKRNLRTRNASHALKVPQGRHLSAMMYRPCGTWCGVGGRSSAGYASLHQRLIKCCPCGAFCHRYNTLTRYLFHIPKGDTEAKFSVLPEVKMIYKRL